MEKLISLIAILLLLTASLPSCSDRKSDPRLIRAELLMDEHPDSALSILDSISFDMLRNDADRALYGMLYTEALDKNHLVPKCDSLSSQAVDFYMKGDDHLRQAISNYYHGRVQYHNKNLASALLSFLKAKKIAEKDSLYFWAGMACRGISDVYNDANDGVQQLKYAQGEYDNMKKSGIQPYLDYALLDLGNAYYNRGHIKKANITAEQLVDSAITHDDPLLQSYALSLRASVFLKEGNFEEAYLCLSEVLKDGYAENQDSLYLCYSMIETGRMDKAIQLLDTISDVDMQLKEYLRYDMAMNNRNYVEALERSVRVDSLIAERNKSIIKANLTGSLTEFYELERKVDEAELETVRIINKSTVMAFSAIILLLVIAGLFVYERQKRKISEKILLANRLNDDLVKVEKENSRATKIIKLMSESKYGLLDELCSVASFNPGTSATRKKIADAVTAIIDDMSTESSRLNELERQMDSIYGNLITDFKKDLPDLKDADYRLYLFSVLGLSGNTIALFLKEDKIEAVYNRKKRLKNKIKSLDAAKRDRYLSPIFLSI